jgi:undecaprenyl-diphosphatase
MPLGIRTIDENILFYIQEHIKSPALDRVMVFITSLGNAGLIWLIIALLLLLRRNYRQCGIYLVLSLYFAMLLGDVILKPAFGRVRPCNEFPDIILLIPRPGSYSFPSGHTMAGFAAATVMFYFDWQLGTAGYILAAMIAFSRIYLFVHYPTDILGGILFGILSSVLLIQGLNGIYRLLGRKYPPSA